MLLGPWLTRVTETAKNKTVDKGGYCTVMIWPFLFVFFTFFPVFALCLLKLFHSILNIQNIVSSL